MNCKTTHAFLLVTLTLFSINNLFSQTTANVSKINDFLEEVYAECPQYQNQDQINFGTEYLQRTLIHSVAVGEYPECPLLSTAGRKDKCNPSMDYELSSFSVENFNPLKYHINYNSKTTQYYRVDGLPYIIEIQPKP